ncbi:armadillo-type protein [Xylogone sp. PMI_703]|nr:armadillo-type protein [Xylogone sp. PMI_703]
MAPRRSAAAEVVEPQGVGLKFNEPLSWRAGKPIATGELLRRLDALSNELREMDQEETDKNSLTKVAKELAGQHLLGHKDRGVRAFTACCLVDVLKLCAPDAPFTGSQLRDIFTLFITTIIPALSDPSNAYNTQHKYVLVSLAEVKSIVLLMDIPNSDALTLHLFTSCFDIVSGSSKASTGEQISKDVDYHMSQLLVTLVDEASSLPSQVVDIIVAQFLRAGIGRKNEGSDENQSTLQLKELPEAYNMAKLICNSCPEKMARYISQYFNDVIMDASSTSNGPSRSNGHRRTSEAEASDEEEEAPSGPTEADLKELQKAHRLLRELWRASPAVLQNVIPQLEAELSAENVQLRLLATETLGDIISGIGAAGPPSPPSMDPAAYPPIMLEDYPSSSISSNILTTPLSPQSFAQTHHGVYNSFIGRRNDKSALIRSSWSTAVGRILVTSAGGIGLSREEESTLVKGLGEKLNDADERVRIAAVKAIGGFSFRDAMEKLAPNGAVNKSGSVLSSLADRARDRKHPVRVEAMTVLSRLWGVATGEILAGNELVIAALDAIPSRIFDAYYANDVELNVLLDHVMFEQLIPLGFPSTKSKGSKANGQSQKEAKDASFDADKVRAERILLVVRSLNPKSKKAFFAMQARQPTFSNVMTAFLKRCEEYNGGVMDKDSKETKAKLDAIIQWLSQWLPDTLRTTHELNKYAKLHDRRSYQLIRFTMAPESDFKTVYKAIKEFSKRMEAAPGAPAGLLETLIPIIYRSASLVYNRSHMPAILKYARTDEDGFAATAHEIIKEISEKSPKVFEVSVKEICKTVVDEAPSETKANEESSVKTLEACAVFARKRSSDLPHDRKFIQALINFALYGSPPKAAKYAVTVLMAASERKEMHAKDLVEKTTKNWVYGEDHFLAKLATICQLQLLEPDSLSEANDEVLNITTQQVLLQVRTEAKESDKGWQADSELDEECQAKIWAIKTLTDSEIAKKLAAPVYKLLSTLIAKAGEISKQGETPKAHKSRLRLIAAQSLLKLCRNKIYDEVLTPDQFEHLAFVAQDPQPEVRSAFVGKLQKYLVKGELSNRFYTIIFLTAFEPVVEFRQSIVTWIRSRAKALNDKRHIIEGIFPRLLSLLAHHPDFSLDASELVDHARYILYYISAIATEENLGLLNKYAERVKQARDVIRPTESNNLYVMSDLAQAVIRKWEEKKGWSVQTWPLKVGMPVSLFGPLASHEIAQEIAEKTYLPDQTDELLDDLVRNIDRKKKRRHEGDEATPRPQLKKVKPERAKGTPKSASAKKERTVKPKTPTRPKKKKDDSEAIPDSERRRSGRSTSRKSYVDRDSSEDDEEMMDGVASWKYEEDDEEDSDEEVGDAESGEGEEANGEEEEQEAEVYSARVDEARRSQT